MPPFIQAVIVSNVIVFLMEAQLGDRVFEWFALWPAGRSAAFGALPDFAPWQLLTYSFLHGGVMHLALNMFALWMFGSDLERVWGSRRVAIAYFASVVSGALAHLLASSLSGANAPVVGASAGVFGILLAYALVFPNRTIVLLFPPIPMPARVFVLLYAVLELTLGVTGTQAGVAHFAHLGGLVGGWLVYRYYRGSPRLRR